MAKKAASARAPKSRDAIQLLRADHAEVAEMFEKYENGRLAKERKTALARKICKALSVHAQIEEEIFYPACRGASKELEEILNQAEVEHGSIKDLVAALEGHSPEDDLFDAQVKVMGEWVTHHVKEEHAEIFPKVKKSKLDLKALGTELAARKQQLMADTSAGSKRDPARDRAAA